MLYRNMWQYHGKQINLARIQKVIFVSHKIITNDCSSFGSHIRSVAKLMQTFSELSFSPKFVRWVSVRSIYGLKPYIHIYQYIKRYLSHP